MTPYLVMVILSTAGFAAQTAAPDQPGDARVVKLSGCVAQPSRTGSLTDDTGAGIVPTPNTAGVEANSSEPVNAYILLDATPAADATATPVRPGAGERTSYSLQGLASELAKHKGHRVEIVGQLLPALPASSAPKSPAAAVRRIAVQTVKMLSERCESEQAR